MGMTHMGEFDIPGQIGPNGDYCYRGDDGTMHTSVVRPSDVRHSIPDEELSRMEPRDAYWLEPGYSFAMINYDTKETRIKYHVIEPHLTELEEALLDALEEKIVKVMDDEDLPLDVSDERLQSEVQRILIKLLGRYRLADPELLKQLSKSGRTVAKGDKGSDNQVVEDQPEGIGGNIVRKLSAYLTKNAAEETEKEIYTDEVTQKIDSTGSKTERDALSLKLSARDVDKFMYYLARRFTGWGRIEPLRSDIGIEDISAGGGEAVWINHSDYNEAGSIETNILYENEKEIASTVKKFAQSNGKGISKRDPQADVTLQDGSRAQLTLGEEVSEKGSNYTIRQFQEVPFTPIDLINWGTYTLEQIAYLWLCVEYNRKIFIVGGTASGKTTTINAISLFVPIQKIVSIEDTPELELPHENWYQMVTNVNKYQETIDKHMSDLLDSSLRQRPTYIILGEVRNEDAAQTLFQCVQSGHTTFTTFHAGSAKSVIGRLTGNRYNIDVRGFEEFDLICVQSDGVGGGSDGEQKRRAIEMVEIGDCDIDSGEATAADINRNRLYDWDPQDGEHKKRGDSWILNEIQQRVTGWTDEELELEMTKRKLLLAYLIKEGYNKYGQVAGTLQAYMADSDRVMSLVANDMLGEYIDNFENISGLDIDVDERTEETISRPSSDRQISKAKDLLEEKSEVLAEFSDHPEEDIVDIVVNDKIPPTSADTLSKQDLPDGVEIEDVAARLFIDEDVPPYPDDQLVDSDLPEGVTVEDVYSRLYAKDVSPLGSDTLTQEDLPEDVDMVDVFVRVYLHDDLPPYPDADITDEDLPDGVTMEDFQNCLDELKNGNHNQQNGVEGNAEEWGPHPSAVDTSRAQTQNESNPSSNKSEDHEQIEELFEDEEDEEGDELGEPETSTSQSEQTHDGISVDHGQSSNTPEITENGDSRETSASAEKTKEVDIGMFDEFSPAEEGESDPAGEATNGSISNEGEESSDSESDDLSEETTDTEADEESGADARGPNSDSDIDISDLFDNGDGSEDDSKVDEDKAEARSNDENEKENSPTLTEIVGEQGAEKLAEHGIESKEISGKKVDKLESISGIDRNLAEEIASDDDEAWIKLSKQLPGDQSPQDVREVLDTDSNQEMQSNGDEKNGSNDEEIRDEPEEVSAQNGQPHSGSTETSEPEEEEGGSGILSKIPLFGQSDKQSNQPEERDDEIETGTDTDSQTENSGGILSRIRGSDPEDDGDEDKPELDPGEEPIEQDGSQTDNGNRSNSLSSDKEENTNEEDDDSAEELNRRHQPRRRRSRRHFENSSEDVESGETGVSDDRDEDQQMSTSQPQENQPPKTDGGEQE